MVIVQDTRTTDAMGRKKLTKGQKQHRKEVKQEEKVFRPARDGFGNWITQKGRISLRIKPETKQILAASAEARGMSMADLISEIAQNRLRLNGEVNRYSDNTKPSITPHSSFQAATRKRYRPANADVVKINPLIRMSAKIAIKLEAEATGLSHGVIVDRWVEAYSKHN